MLAVALVKRPTAVAGKVTVGLTSHWPCVTDSVVYPPTGSMAWGREMSTSPTIQKSVEHSSVDYFAFQ